MDLRTNYLGLELKHPLVASASALSKSLDGIEALAEAGASAIVLHSLFEEQIEAEQAALDHFGKLGSDSFTEASGFFPQTERFEIGPEEYLDHIRQASKAVQVPIIASLNGTSEGGWVNYAVDMERAGAAAIELNIFWVASDIRLDGQAVEDRYVHIAESVRKAVRIPVAVKLSPYFSSFASFARRLAQTGIDGLVLFNRFYQPDIDLERLEVLPNLELSTPLEIRQGLLWIGVLRDQLAISLAATSGVHGAAEAIKYLLVGADVVMTTSSLLHNGPQHMGVILDGLVEWAEKRGYSSVSQLRGSMSRNKVRRPEAFERSNYIKILESYHQ